MYNALCIIHCNDFFKNLENYSFVKTAQFSELYFSTLSLPVACMDTTNDDIFNNNYDNDVVDDDNNNNL